MRSVSVVVPVRDGERYLEEVLAGVRREGDVELLVIDSGSRDRSVDIVRAAGADLLRIDPSVFGHGRTRNLGAERTSGELICFLTQDATPVAGWLDAYREAFEVEGPVGAAFGPHLPRLDTSPMIARELIEFFPRFSPNGRPAVQRAGDDAFLSNVNACYARECWAEIRFRDLPYAEDQAFGRDMLERGWAKVYHPGAAVLHAHDYGTIDFMRRYFDEYRGLRETTGYLEPLRPARVARDLRDRVAADRRYMTEQGVDGRRRARWTARSLVHHAGRTAFAALGSRANDLPASVERFVSLEADGKAAGPPRTSPSGGSAGAGRWGDVLRFRREGAAPLVDPVPGMSARERLHLGIVIPPFQRGGGGHNTIFQLVSQLEALGHTCSIWLSDPAGDQGWQWPATIRREIREHFAPVEAPVHKDFSRWFGADVVVATGWQTVHHVMMLKGCRARAYLVNDHEPQFFPTSAEEHWAEETYRLGLYCISASPWLRDELHDRYGAPGCDFQLAVNHDAYRPRPVERCPDTVVFYGRAFTPRRAVPLGLLALEELRRRRPEVRVVIYGQDERIETPVSHEHVGVVSPEQLSWLYSEATVGLCLSATNFSLIPKEMLACGLPCVELAGVSAESIFGEAGPIELAEFDPIALADAIERLLDERDLWERRSREGIELVAGHTWDVAAAQVDAGLREALRLREAAPARAG